MESSPELTPVRPTRPPAAYVGGKRNLSRRLVERIEAVPHTAYCEPFVGMGGVFLRRGKRPKVEVINDASQDVATLFRVLQRHYAAFVDLLRFQVTSRAEWDRLIRTDPTTLTDLERSARFLYLQRCAFGGKVVGRSFGVSYADTAAGARFDLTKIRPMLEDLHERLAGVLIERLPYGEFIPRYDRPGVLFFCDPPYWGCEADYGPTFERADFERLKAVLTGLKGRFILTLNDAPEVRALFSGFEIEPVPVTYRLSGAPTPARELIISGGGPG